MQAGKRKKKKAIFEMSRKWKFWFSKTDETILLSESSRNVLQIHLGTLQDKKRIFDIAQLKTKHRKKKKQRYAFSYIFMNSNSL